MKQHIRIAIAQINPTVGDIRGNAAKILDYAFQAKQAGASLMLTPELALCGYPPEDLLMRQDFNLACEEALTALAKTLPEITLVVGHPAQENNHCFNAASVLQGGRIISTYYKQVLPNYSVFDEVRYFSSGKKPLLLEHAGTTFGILICADVWESEPAKQAKQAGAQALLVLNASPFHIDKQDARHEVVKARVNENQIPIVYANMVGGQDELVFDGGSFVMCDRGEICYEMPAFVESINVFEWVDGRPKQQVRLSQQTTEAAIYHALCLGLKDYVHKNGFPGIVLGLSGGVDSALTMAIAVDALGKDAVTAVMMPSEFTANMSIEDAREMATTLGVHYQEYAIKPLYDMYIATLADTFKGLPFDATEENLQARIRGMLLMALSNKFGAIVLTTGNKSEMAVGYSTLYGDMAGGFALLKDVPKTMVYKLCHYRNGLFSVISKRIIERAPSAELRADQKDQDSLPAYEILDGIMQAYVEDDMSFDDIVLLGYKKSDVKRVLGLIDRNEYKRRQSPIGVRITNRGFGKDRRYPITTKYDFSKR